MNTEKITSEEMDVQNDLKFIAQKSWELAKEVFWKDEELNTKKDRRAVQNISFLLWITPDPTTAYHNLCENITCFRKQENGSTDNLRGSKQNKKREYLLQFFTGAFIKDFSETTTGAYFKESMCAVINTAPEVLYGHWKYLALLKDISFLKLMKPAMADLLQKKQWEIEFGRKTRTNI